MITTVSANDVDTNPALTYSLQEEGLEGVQVDGVFSIDRFSGKVILGRPLDFENRQEYRLKISASDTAHTADTVLTVKVTDDNDNPPIFSQASYKANLIGKIVKPLYNYSGIQLFLRDLYFFVLSFTNVV